MGKTIPRLTPKPSESPVDFFDRLGLRGGLEKARHSFTTHDIAENWERARYVAERDAIEGILFNPDTGDWDKYAVTYEEYVGTGLAVVPDLVVKDVRGELINHADEARARTLIMHQLSVFNTVDLKCREIPEDARPDLLSECCGQIILRLTAEYVHLSGGGNLVRQLATVATGKLETDGRRSYTDGEVLWALCEWSRRREANPSADVATIYDGFAIAFGDTFTEAKNPVTGKKRRDCPAINTLQHWVNRTGGKWEN